jgi:hypothetical protein
MTQTHRHHRDFYFIGLVGVTLLSIGGFLLGSVGDTGPESSGWRRIDLERLEMRLDSGELQRREADWYEPLQE